MAYDMRRHESLRELPEFLGCRVPEPMLAALPVVHRRLTGAMVLYDLLGMEIGKGQFRYHRTPPGRESLM